MKTMEIKQLLQRYFEGQTTVNEERELNAYFNSGEVAEELKEYAGFFRGMSDLKSSIRDNTLEKDIMDYIRINEPAKNPKRRWLWQTVSGIAASVILVVGGFLFYQQQEQQFTDTFDNPEAAYAYAEQTLAYVSAKYTQGLSELANFDKLQIAAEPLHQGFKPVNEYLGMVEKMHSTNKAN